MVSIEGSVWDRIFGVGEFSEDLRSVIIMRGIPGSGKSTIVSDLSKRVVENSGSRVVCSTDDFFMVDGVYKYDPRLASENHNLNLAKFIESLRSGVQVVFVDNTNTTAVEIAPYYRLAQVYGYSPVILTLLCDPIAAMGRGLHSVPQDVVWSMYQNLCSERMPGYWKHVLLRTGKRKKAK